MVKVLLGALSVVFIASANCEPYIGMDAQLRHIDFKQSFEGISVKRNYPQANVFAGLMYNDFIGIEAGYTFSKKQYTTSKSNPIFIPHIYPRINTVKYDMNHATPKINALNLNLIGSFPLRNDMKIIGSIGLTHLKIHIINILSNMENIHYINHKT